MVMYFIYIQFFNELMRYGYFVRFMANNMAYGRVRKWIGPWEWPLIWGNPTKTDI